MDSPTIVTFFYGSYINLDVLREVDLVPERVEVARLPGFDLLIRPLANLVPSDEHTVYGILATATHAELDRLYEHAQHVLGGSYLPRAVLAHTLSGQFEPALCYIAPSLEPADYQCSSAYWPRATGCTDRYRSHRSKHPDRPPCR